MAGIWRTARRAPARALLYALLLGLLLALLPGGGAQAQGATPVFALAGRLEPQAGVPAAVLIQADGTRAGLTGATPAVEAQIGALAQQRAAVLVWGVRAPTPAATGAQITVSRIEVVTAPATPAPPAALPTATRTGTPQPPRAPMGPVLRPTNLPTIPIRPTPTATPRPTLISLADVGQPTARITVYAAQIRLGPGSDYAPLATAAEGATCLVLGRALAPGWYYVQCPAATGWVNETLLALDGPLDALPLLAPLTPTPTPSATPALIWRIAGYANRNLEGEPAVTFQAPAVDFAWGLEAPHPELPADNFSLRLDGVLRFAPGPYRLTLTYDDGVRLYMNNQLVINDWNEGAARSQSGEGQLAGDVALRIEYFDAYGDAQLQLTITPLQPAAATPTLPAAALAALTAPPPAQAWLAAYFNNPTLSGAPAFVRTEMPDSDYPLNREFSVEAPVPEVIAPDNWSARWRGRFTFAAGDYRFLARGNDGVRLYVDGLRVINAWPNTADTVSNILRGVAAGEHEIAVEMYDAGGLAWVRAWWEALE